MRRHWANSRGIRIPPTRTASGGGPPVVGPDSISGLALWIDPSDASTVSYSAAPFITQIDDKASGVMGRVAGDQYFLATSAALEPPMETINGRDAIRFAGPGAADYLRLYTGVTTPTHLTQTMNSGTSYPGSGTQTQDGIIGSGQSCTMIAVLELVASPTLVGQFYTYNHPAFIDLARGYGPAFYSFNDSTYGTSLPHLRSYMYSYQSPYDTFAGQATAATSQGLPITVGTPFLAVWRHADPGPLFATSDLDGATSLASPPASGGTVQTRSYQNYWQTKLAYLGIGYSGSQYIDCRIGEVCVWDSAVSDADLASLAPYFSSRWGV